MWHRKQALVCIVGSQNCAYALSQRRSQSALFTCTMQTKCCCPAQMIFRSARACRCDIISYHIPMLGLRAVAGHILCSHADWLKMFTRSLSVWLSACLPVFLLTKRPCSLAGKLAKQAHLLLAAFIISTKANTFPGHINKLFVGKCCQVVHASGD